MDEDLEKQFQKAFKISSNTKIQLPPDVMLQIYAYYKQATRGNNYIEPSGDVELKNAFKLNAWIQLSHLSEEEAKKGYIELVNKYFK